MGRDEDGRRVERVVVIGLGRFGTSAARTLHGLGYEVTAVDVAEKAVAAAAGFVTLAAKATAATMSCCARWRSSAPTSASSPRPSAWSRARCRRCS